MTTCSECGGVTEATGGPVFTGEVFRLCPSCGWDGSPNPDRISTCDGWDVFNEDEIQRCDDSSLFPCDLSAATAALMAVVHDLYVAKSAGGALASFCQRHGVAPEEARRWVVTSAIQTLVKEVVSSEHVETVMDVVYRHQDP